MFKRILLLQFLIALGLAGLASATTIDFTNPITHRASQPCGAFPGRTCTTTAYFDAQSLDDQNDETLATAFEAEFKAWNDTNGPLAKWSLDFGGNPGGTFDITLAVACLHVDDINVCQNGGVLAGGAQIDVTPVGLTLPAAAPGQLLGWSQGVFSNFFAGGGFGAPYHHLDITSGACDNATKPKCPPLYPFQYPGNEFFDGPSAYFRAPGLPQAFFDAQAYLSLADYNTRKLTVYDGISYGFQNSVSPEPPVWILLMTGSAALFILARRRTAKPRFALAGMAGVRQETAPRPGGRGI